MSGSKIHIVCGSPGSGKSTYGRQLAQKQGATLLDIDTCTERLVQLGLHGMQRNPDDRDSEFYKHRFRGPVYDTLFEIAQENLAWMNVVVVAPFTREIRNASWPTELQSKLGVSVEVHYLFCCPEERRQRLACRGKARDLAKLSNWERYLEYYGEEKAPEFSHTFVDTTSRPARA